MVDFLHSAIDEDRHHTTWVAIVSELIYHNWQAIGLDKNYAHSQHAHSKSLNSDVLTGIVPRERDKRAEPLFLDYQSQRPTVPENCSSHSCCRRKRIHFEDMRNTLRSLLWCEAGAVLYCWSKQLWWTPTYPFFHWSDQQIFATMLSRPLFWSHIMIMFIHTLLLLIHVYKIAQENDMSNSAFLFIFNWYHFKC